MLFPGVPLMERAEVNLSHQKSAVIGSSPRPILSPWWLSAATGGQVQVEAVLCVVEPAEE